MGVQEPLREEAKARAEKAGDLLASEGRDLLAQAKQKLDEEVENVKQQAEDKVSEVVREKTDGLSEKLAGALRGKKK